MTTTTTEHFVPCIELLRATVAFDEFCRTVHDYFDEVKTACVRHDLTPEVEQLEAMLLDRAGQYVGPGWEQDAIAAVGNLVAAIARPEDGWGDES